MIPFCEDDLPKVVCDDYMITMGCYKKNFPKKCKNKKCKKYLEKQNIW